MEPGQRSWTGCELAPISVRVRSGRSGRPSRLTGASAAPRVYDDSVLPVAAGLAFDTARPCTSHRAQAQRAAARAELDGTPAPNLLTDAEVYAMVDSLGDVGAALSDAKEVSLADLYTAIDLKVRYEPAEDSADVGIRLGRRVNSAGVRGGT
jgi:hypothetical protein